MDNISFYCRRSDLTSCGSTISSTHSLWWSSNWPIRRRRADTPNWNVFPRPLFQIRELPISRKKSLENPAQDSAKSLFRESFEFEMALENQAGHNRTRRRRIWQPHTECINDHNNRRRAWTLSTNQSLRAEPCRFTAADQEGLALKPYHRDTFCKLTQWAITITHRQRIDVPLGSLKSLQVSALDTSAFWAYRFRLLGIPSGRKTGYGRRCRQVAAKRTIRPCGCWPLLLQRKESSLLAESRRDGWLLLEIIDV